MTFKPFAAAAIAAASTLALASGASAQPAATPVVGGPPINGVCILSMQGAIGASTVGKYVDTRVQQIAQQVNSELNAERSSIETDGKTLESQRASLDQNSLDARAAQLQVRAAALQRKVQLREREMQATEQKALGRVEQEMEPLIKQAYQQKNCSVLLAREAVLLGNPAMDITPTVVTALNAKITQFPFDREHLDTAQASAGAAPPVATVPNSQPARSAAKPAARRR